MNLAIFAQEFAQRLNNDDEATRYVHYRAVWGELQCQSHKYPWNGWQRQGRAKDLEDTYFSLEKCPEDAPRLALSSDKFIALIALMYFELVLNKQEEAYALRE